MPVSTKYHTGLSGYVILGHKPGFNLDKGLSYPKIAVKVHTKIEYIASLKRRRKMVQDRGEGKEGGVNNRGKLFRVVTIYEKLIHIYIDLSLVNQLHQCTSIIVETLV